MATRFSKLYFGSNTKLTFLFLLYLRDKIKKQGSWAVEAI